MASNPGQLEDKGTTIDIGQISLTYKRGFLIRTSNESKFLSKSIKKMTDYVCIVITVIILIWSLAYLLIEVISQT